MFGRITENQMCLNAAGAMIEMWWRKLAGKFPLVETDEYVVMPNHFHGIVYVGAILCGRPGVKQDRRVLGNVSRRAGVVVRKTFAFLLDKREEIWSNVYIMKQVDRKNTGNWWWPSP